MKRLLNLLPMLLISGLCVGQLINDGGTITIQNGAKLYVETDVTNNVVSGNTGNIIVNGELEIQGNLTNNGTMTTGVNSLVKFSGNTNSDVLSNGAVIENMQMVKDGALGTVTLMDDLTVKTNLDFEPSTVDSLNQLVLGANDLILLEQATTITDPTSQDYIVADGMGQVQKNTDADALFLFPIGDAMNYSPVTADYTGTTYTNANVRANVAATTHPNKPTEGTDFIARYWNVDQTDITGYAADLTGEYAAADVTGTATSVMGATQPDMSTGMTLADWTFTGSDNGASTVSASVTDDADLTGFNFFGKANVKVFLQGAYDSSSGLMSTTLPTLASFPMSTPYDVAPFNAPVETATTVPADVTDWILVEARDPAVPATVFAQKSAFLKNDGTIVGLDGGDLVIKDAKPSSIIAIQHRNHLAVRTNAGQDLSLVNPTLFDMSQDTAMYNDAAIVNGPQALLGAVSGMYGGDVNQDGFIRYTDFFQFPSTFIDSDAVEIFSTLGNNTSGQLDIYQKADVNFDGYVRYTDFFQFPSTFIDSDAVKIFSILGNITSGQLTKNL